MGLLHLQGEEEAEEHQLQEVVVAAELRQLALGVEGEGGLRGLCRAEGEAEVCPKMGVVVAAEELEGFCLMMEEVVAAEEEEQLRSTWEGEGEEAQKDLGLMKGAAEAVEAAEERLMKSVVVVVEGAPR